jgi:antitoxin component YwqK of YwqJK toxin-antitoxin module
MKYAGDWKDGNPHGNGKEYYENGNPKYEGEYKDGKFHGIGFEHGYGEDGETFWYCGKWENGKRDCWAESYDWRGD